MKIEPQTTQNASCFVGQKYLDNILWEIDVYECDYDFGQNLENVAKSWRTISNWHFWRQDTPVLSM